MISTFCSQFIATKKSSNFNQQPSIRTFFNNLYKNINENNPNYDLGSFPPILNLEGSCDKKKITQIHTNSGLTDGSSNATLPNLPFREMCPSENWRGCLDSDILTSSFRESVDHFIKFVHPQVHAEHPQTENPNRKFCLNFDTLNFQCSDFSDKHEFNFAHPWRENNVTLFGASSHEVCPACKVKLDSKCCKNPILKKSVILEEKPVGFFEDLIALAETGALGLNVVVLKIRANLGRILKQTDKTVIPKDLIKMGFDSYMVTTEDSQREYSHGALNSGCRLAK